MIRFSVIIPFQAPNAYLSETLEHLAALDRSDLEIILLPDGDMAPEGYGAGPHPIQIIPTGPVSPAVKRDKGAELAKGDILAFIDDDAYPGEGWPGASLALFESQDVAAVGGPQVTPPGDGFGQRVSGAMFLSPLNGKAVCRYRPCAKRFDVDDWPSVNLLVRKADFAAVGGFDSQYWPGEDTKLCHDLVVKLGKRIVYEPGMVVFHHRRAGFLKHMKQVGNYGLHRGHFARRYPASSRKPAYFVPSCFFLFVVLGWIFALLGGAWATLYALGWLAYLAALGLSAATVKKHVASWPVALMSTAYLAATHFWYGLRFLQGFTRPGDLKSKLGR